MKSDFLASLTILKKKMCLGIVSACGFDPVVELHSGTLLTTAYLLLGYMAPN
jgi:hypothetical protein